MPIARPPSTSLPQAVPDVCDPVVWRQALDGRTELEPTAHQPTQAERPAVSRSWRAPAETSTAPPPDPAEEELRRLYKRGGRFSVALIEMRRRFGGDLDQYLIYQIVMLAELSHGKADTASTRNGLNAFSIAEITRIPRETVRRKLRLMVDGGHIRRADDGLYYPGPAATLDRFFVELSSLL